MKTLSSLLLFAFFINGCTYPCAKSDGLIVNFISYTESEIQSYTIKKYSKGSGFNVFIDSLVVDSSIAGYTRNNDTLVLASSKGRIRLTSDFDYQLVVPAANKIYNITDIEEPQTEGKKSNKKILCVNPIVSCKINGGLNQIIHFDRLYLKK